MRRRLAPLILGAAACAVASISLVSRVNAEPRFAVREGMQCRHCHINRTGGGMRTPFGVSFAQSNLSTYRAAGVFDPNLGESVSFGANLRLSNRTVLPARTKIEDVERRTRTRNTFDINEGNIYLLARAIPNRLSLYIDETVTPEAASSREAFVLVEGLPLDGYVKAGRFMLPFGLRIPDDRAFIRGETGFNYANADLGVEFGIAPGPFALTVAVTNGSLGGNDTNRAKQISTHATFVTGRARAGLSFAWNDTSAEDFAFQSFTSGAHLGARFGRLYLLGEIDWIRGVTKPKNYDQVALYVEGNYEFLKGLYGRFIFEAFDPLRSLDENERDRFIAGVSWFPTQLLELRAEYRLNRDIPQRVEGTADEIVVELHGFL